MSIECFKNEEANIPFQHLTHIYVLNNQSNGGVAKYTFNITWCKGLYIMRNAYLIVIIACMCCFYRQNKVQLVRLSNMHIFFKSTLQNDLLFPRLRKYLFHNLCFYIKEYDIYDVVTKNWYCFIFSDEANYFFIHSSVPLQQIRCHGLHYSIQRISINDYVRYAKTVLKIWKPFFKTFI